ncbi:hypothetical protein K1719_032256 [Acacia pycnantha]|nr:hypothetical protein K1719_032256 [Acacia pycnantha]
MRPNCCQTCLSFCIKFLNFLQCFIGISIILYSAWFIDKWSHPIPLPPSPAPSPSFSLSIPVNSQPLSVSAQINHLNLVLHTVSSFDDVPDFDSSSFQLPAPWFIYSFMGVGILMFCISLLGCIAAEAFNGCCLCFYNIIITLFVLLEAALVTFIAVDHRWEKDLPFDPTGELQSLKSFIEDNLDMCKWVGITVVVVQALSLLLSLNLRATVSTQSTDFDDEDEYDNRGRSWDPLLKHQSGQSSGLAKSDIRGSLSDWSSRMREKYKLNSGEKYNLPIQNTPANQNSRQ